MTVGGNKLLCYVYLTMVSVVDLLQIQLIWMCCTGSLLIYCLVAINQYG